MQRQIKKLNRPSLADWRKTAEGIQPAFCRLLSSLAVKDGSVIPGAVPILLEAVEEMARADENGHVSANLALYSVTQPVPLSDAINAIKIATKGAGATEREALLRIVLPLVAARGSDARDTAKKISSALNVKLSEIDLLALPDLKVDGQTFLGGLTDRAKGLVGLNSERDAVIDLALSYGEDDIATKVHGAWGGENRSGAMRDAVISLTRHMQSDISAYHEMAVLAQKTQDLASSLVDAAETAFDQINQRLAIIERRMDLLRNDLEEDIERLIDDTGNELKTTMQERFRTDDWTKREAWENFARTQAGKQIELRLNNLRQRYHEHIDVLRDELRVFQNELRITKTKLIPKVSSREIAGIMRGTSLATRMLNKTDEVARVSLWSSVVGGVGLGGVTWGLTAAHVVAFSALAPILAPAAIGLGAVFGASALYKLATDSEGRKQREISEKASQFEGFIEERMRGVLGEQSKQLNELLASFYSSASTILEPIMISAEAARDITSLRQSLSDHLIRQTENKIKMLGRMVEG